MSDNGRALSRKGPEDVQSACQPIEWVGYARSEMSQVTKSACKL
jgi:hypothetical protein